MAVVVLDHDSEALRANPLGDPHRRRLHLVVPDDLDPSVPVPVVWWLAGYAGVGRGMLGDDPWQEGLEERLIRLRAEGAIGPMIVALPDCFTKYGGSQYLSSPAHGDYETYLVEELAALVASRWAVTAHGIAGKSSGGYGAIVHAMRHPDRFAAVACHSGDMGFRLAFTGELPLLMNALRRHGGIRELVAAFEAETKKKTGSWIGVMSMLAYAAAWSPDPEAPLGIALPFDLETGDVDEAVFARWLARDPVRMIDDPALQDALRRLRLVFIDCGDRDEYHLQWGARGFVRKLAAAGVPHQYEEFPDGHRSTSYRLDVSLPKLYHALSAEP
jgi:S-formylglutathione hydrolase FrmB